MTGESEEPGGDNYVAQRFGTRDWRSLRDMLEFGNRAARLVARGRDAYDHDEMLQYAAQKICIDLGEAATRLSSELIATHPEINFVGMRRQRNHVTHRYDIIDTAIVWNTIAIALPADLRRVRELLARTDDQS